MSRFDADAKLYHYVIRTPGTPSKSRSEKMGANALQLQGACAEALAASSFASLRGVTPDPLLARPFCGLSPDVQKHAGRQSWKGLSRHTVRHLRWQLKVETEFRENDAQQK